jgi:hypothetical protein
LQIRQIPGSLNKLFLRIHLGLESLFVCSESLESDLLFVWKSLKVTGTVGIVLSLHLVVWVLCQELGNGTHYHLKRLGSEPTTVCYCLRLETASTSFWETPATCSHLFSFVLIAVKLYITVHCASCLFRPTLAQSDLARTLA